jgi:ABC-type transporter Mla maintaining outer membrane lipid asymmetry ATPase subunit MlaF
MLTFVYAFDCKKLILRIFSVNPLFRNLNLSVEKGRIIAFWRKWLWKIYLLNIIYDLIDWQSGEIFLEDENSMVQKETLFPEKKV